MDDYYTKNEYKAKRVNAYPQEWRDQLEMLWKDIDSGVFGEAAKAGSWYQLLKKIRDDFPKPTE